jgi:IS5 family transposase
MSCWLFFSAARNKAISSTEAGRGWSSARMPATITSKAKEKSKRRMVVRTLRREFVSARFCRP